MRILYIITQGEQGGAQKYTLDLAMGYKEQGDEVYVATGVQKEEKDKWLFQELSKNGIPEINLIEIKNLKREISIFSDIKSLFDTIKLIKKVKPDVIHMSSSKAGFTGSLASFLTGVKSVYTVHGFVFLEPMNLLKKLFYIWLEFTSSLFRSKTLLITKKDISIGRKFLVLRNKKNYELIYNGLKQNSVSKMFSENDARKFIFEKIGIQDEGQRIVGTIANFYRTKGLEYFITSSKKVLEEKPNTLFIHVGFGDSQYEKELKEEVRNLNLSVLYFLGKVPDAINYLKAFHVFVLTSVKEGLPYTLLEAHLAGNKIVATNVGGIPEIGEYIPLTLAKIKDADDIAKKIIENLDKEKMESYLMPPVFTFEKMLKDTKKLYLN